MKSLRLLAVALALAGAFIPLSSQAAETVSLDYFYDALAPYGEWIYVEEYGYCWRPAVAVQDPNWRPYADGYWGSTDEGWTWVSYEDWGWATYHYGRWAIVSGYWCWVPGEQWAPAWVSWRSSDRYVGWAPLPPEAVWQPNVGFGVWVDSYYDIGPGCYNFVPVHRFGAPLLAPLLLPYSRNITVIQTTSNCTSFRPYTGGIGRVFVGGPDLAFIERHAERKVPRFHLQQNAAVNFRAGNPDFRPRLQGDALIVAAPGVQRPVAVPPPKHVTARFGTAAVQRGWSPVQDKALAETLRAKHREDAGTLPAALPPRPERAFTGRGMTPPAAIVPNAPVGVTGPASQGSSPGSVPTVPGTRQDGRNRSQPGIAAQPLQPAVIPGSPDPRLRHEKGKDKPESSVQPPVSLVPPIAPESNTPTAPSDRTKGQPPVGGPVLPQVVPPGSPGSVPPQQPLTTRPSRSNRPEPPKGPTKSDSSGQVSQVTPPTQIAPPTQAGAATQPPSNSPGSGKGRSKADDGAPAGIPKIVRQPKPVQPVTQQPIPSQPPRINPSEQPKEHPKSEAHSRSPHVTPPAKPVQVPPQPAVTAPPTQSVQPRVIPDPVKSRPKSEDRPSHSAPRIAPPQPKHSEEPKQKKPEPGREIAVPQKQPTSGVRPQGGAPSRPPTLEPASPSGARGTPSNKGDSNSKKKEKKKDEKDDK